MKKYRVFDIEWDMGDEDVKVSLPDEMEVMLEDDEDPKEHAADACTDKTGYLIIGCKVEAVSDRINPMFTRLSQHVGHAIDCVGYGTNGEYVNISIECLDCNEVLYDAEKYEKEV